MMLVSTCSGSTGSSSLYAKTVRWLGNTKFITSGNLFSIGSTSFMSGTIFSSVLTLVRCIQSLSLYLDNVFGCTSSNESTHWKSSHWDVNTPWLTSRSLYVCQRRQRGRTLLTAKNTAVHTAGLLHWPGDNLFARWLWNENVNENVIWEMF